MNGQYPLTFLPPASSQPGFQRSLHQVQSFFRVPSVFSLLSNPEHSRPLPPWEKSLLYFVTSVICVIVFCCCCYLSLSSFVWSFNSFSPISCYPDGGTSRYQSGSSGLLSLYWALDIFFSQINTIIIAVSKSAYPESTFLSKFLVTSPQCITIISNSKIQNLTHHLAPKTNSLPRFLISGHHTSPMLPNMCLRPYLFLCFLHQPPHPMDSSLPCL